MYCSSCGEKIEDTSKFCPFCGSKIKDGSTGDAGTNREGLFDFTGINGGPAKGKAFQGFRKPGDLGEEENGGAYENAWSASVSSEKDSPESGSYGGGWTDRSFSDYVSSDRERPSAFEAEKEPGGKPGFSGFKDSFTTTASGFKEKLIGIKDVLQRNLIGRGAIVAAIAAIIVFIFAFSFVSRRMVDEPCDWCNKRPTMAFKTSDGSLSYVCSECRKECKWCGKKATKHYENLVGMIVFVCDDCYKEVTED